MSTTRSALAAALKLQFPGADGPRRLMRQLGLDSDLLAPGGGEPAASGGDNGEKRLRDLRVALEQMLDTENWPDAVTSKLLALLDQHVTLDAADPNASRARELSEDQEAAFGKYFRERGLSDSDIAESLRLLKGGNAAAKDRLPVPAPRGLGGYGHMGANDRMALDDINRLMSAIKVEPSLRPSYSGSRPIGPSQASTFAEMFPDADKIGIGAH
jgi:hypothetical protein